MGPNNIFYKSIKYYVRLGYRSFSEHATFFCQKGGLVKYILQMESSKFLPFKSVFISSTRLQQETQRMFCQQNLF